MSASCRLSEIIHCPWRFVVRSMDLFPLIAYCAKFCCRSLMTDVRDRLKIYPPLWGQELFWKSNPLENNSVLCAKFDCWAEHQTVHRAYGTRQICTLSEWNLCLRGAWWIFPPIKHLFVTDCHAKVGRYVTNNVITHTLQDKRRSRVINVRENSVRRDS